jgi:hypothetical protein
MMRTVEISSLQRAIAHRNVHSNARNEEKKRDAVHHHRIHSGGICATCLPHYLSFFYKNVAFFFVGSLELAHQAS